MSGDLLHDRLIRVETDDGLKRLSLPEVLSQVARDGVRSFPALRAHQRHAWHAFLAQLGTIALHAAGRATAPEDPEPWLDLLRNLTPEDQIDASWRLVVDDPCLPAFLQPPSPSDGATFSKRIETPDALDVLVTARNFDVKRAVAINSEPDDWIFALVSLQTMEGFLGGGNYGVARMNGGFSSRSFLGLAPASGGFGAHVRRDWAAMLERRSTLAKTYGYPSKGGLALLWLEPWDGQTSLSLHDLDPFFIEVCRRVRLSREAGRLIARGMSTATTRVSPKDRESRDIQGVTGDFWAPVNRVERKAFSLTAAGFSAGVMCRLLFGEEGARIFDDPPSLALTVAEQDVPMDWLLVARGVARGQGKTEGLHERVIPFSHRMVSALGDPETRTALGAIAEAQLLELRHILKSLRLACAVVASGGSADAPSRDRYKAADPYTSRLEAVGDTMFFAALADRFEQRDGARDAFLRALVKRALLLLDEASAVIPCATLRRARARVRARGSFFNSLWSARGPLSGDRDLFQGDRDAA